MKVVFSLFNGNNLTAHEVIWATQSGSAGGWAKGENGVLCSWSSETNVNIIYCVRSTVGRISRAFSAIRKMQVFNVAGRGVNTRDEICATVGVKQCGLDERYFGCQR